MMNPKDTIARVRAFAETAGISLATIGKAATNNARLVDRLERRFEKVVRDCEALEEYMASNPPVKRDGSLACSPDISPNRDICKGAAE